MFKIILRKKYVIGVIYQKSLVTIFSILNKDLRTQRIDFYHLLLLGHICWAYIIGKSSASLLRLKPNVYIILLLGVLPDIDLIMGSLGIEHRTLTHSIIIWSIIFGPFLARYQKLALPYFAAVMQHILFGDLVVGKVNFLWPLFDFEFGLGIRIMSIENLVLEGSGLAIFLFWTFLERRKKTFIVASPQGFFSLILIVILLAAFSFFALIDDQYISTIADYSRAKYLEKALQTFFASSLLPIVAIMHLILLSMLSVPLVLTIKFLANKSSNKNARVKA